MTVFGGSLFGSGGTNRMIVFVGSGFDGKVVIVALEARLSMPVASVELEVERERIGLRVASSKAALTSQRL